MKSIIEIARNNTKLRSLREGFTNSKFVVIAGNNYRSLFKKKILIAKADNLLTEQRQMITRSDRESLFEDMLKMYRKHGFDFSEYLGYHFDDKVIQERLEFVNDHERTQITDSMNNSDNCLVFDNKALTYNAFKPFFKRNVMFCDNNTTFSIFHSFLQNIKKTGEYFFALKPLMQSCGKGFSIESVECSEEHFSELKKKYRRGFLAEEKIVQDERIAAFHHSSVNTIRMTTIRFDDDTLVVHPFLRIGQHGNIVDNSSAGGLVCLLNADDGEVFCVSDERGIFYSRHPDSDLQIVGFKVPLWREAISFVKELAKVIPDNRYTGWDIALSNKGWMLVEANRRGQFVWQYPLQAGCRTEFLSYLERLHRSR